MTQSKIWLALAILFAGSTAVLLYGALNSAVSYSNCFDELEHASEREHLVQELLKPLYPELGRAQVAAAARKAGVAASAFDKGPRETVVAGMSFIFDESGRVSEIQFK